MVSRSHRCLALAAALLLFAACTTPGPLDRPLEADPQQVCARFYQALDAAIEEHGVRDAEAARIAGFPYLRVDRFLASFRESALDETAFEQWVMRLWMLGNRGYEVELFNLPIAARRALAAQVPGGHSLDEAVHTCGTRLRRADLKDADRRRALRERAVVPDAYRTSWRVLGLYPISALFMAGGIERYHDETHATFATPLERLPVRGTLVRYVPEPAAPLAREAVAAILARAAARDPLGIPEPDEEDRARLFAAFAPVFEIDTVEPADRLGAPRWHEAEMPDVDIADPIVYRRLSHARFGNEILMQLNYVVWFPARPRTDRLDLLGGHLDGITWRVTLAPDGDVLLYDSMHNCGCFHMFFPGARLKVRSREARRLEPPLVPQHAPALAPGERLVIRVAHRTHYLERLYAVREAEGVRYRFEDYDALRSLPTAAGARRSLFGADGIIASSRRAERFLFWPMGVPSPGAMRQWGQHATAFVGRRHFDDPKLIERLFEPQAVTAR